MMKNLASIFLIFSISTSAVVAFAKRMPPKPVPPVVANGIRYTAPQDPMGHVVAIDIRKGEVLWDRQIYVVKFNPEVEGDVQACYITNLKLDSKKLVITNEIGNIYELDLSTLDVRSLKGNVVVQKFR